MADIPGISGIGLSLNWGSIWAKTVLGLEIVAVIAILGLGFYFLILKKSRYKDYVEITDLQTNQKWTDKGYLKEGRDGTQEYKLLKGKKAKLDIPPSSQFTTKRGKVIRQLVKYGPGDYNWAGLMEAWDPAKKEIKEYHITNLTDQNWTKDGLRRDIEKRNSMAGLKQYLPQIMIGAVIVMFIISAWFITGTMKTGIGVAQNAIKTGADISRENADTARLLAGVSIDSGKTVPPPGI